MGFIVITLIYEQYLWVLWRFENGVNPNTLMYLLNVMGIVLLTSILIRKNYSSRLTLATITWALLNFLYGVYNFQMFQPILGGGLYFWTSNLVIHLLIMLPVVLYCHKLKHNKRFNGTNKA